MAQMPNFEEEIRRDLSRAGHDVADGMRHLMHPRLHHRDAAQPPTQTPASGPVNLAAGAAEPPKENPVSLTQITDDVREDLTAGITYAKELFTRLEGYAPGIIATVDTVANDTVGQIAEKLAGSVIPAEAQPFLLGLVDDFVKRYGQSAPAPVAPAAPATPAPAQ